MQTINDNVMKFGVKMDNLNTKQQFMLKSIQEISEKVDVKIITPPITYDSRYHNTIALEDEALYEEARKIEEANKRDEENKRDEAMKLEEMRRLEKAKKLEIAENLRIATKLEEERKREDAKIKLIEIQNERKRLQEQQKFLHQQEKLLQDHEQRTHLMCGYGLTQNALIEYVPEEDDMDQVEVDPDDPMFNNVDTMIDDNQVITINNGDSHIDDFVNG